MKFCGLTVAIRLAYQYRGEIEKLTLSRASVCLLRFFCPSYFTVNFAQNSFQHDHVQFQRRGLITINIKFVLFFVFYQLPGSHFKLLFSLHFYSIYYADALNSLPRLKFICYVTLLVGWYPVGSLRVVLLKSLVWSCCSSFYGVSFLGFFLRIPSICAFSASLSLLKRFCFHE